MGTMEMDCISVAQCCPALQEHRIACVLRDHEELHSGTALELRGTVLQCERAEKRWAVLARVVAQEQERRRSGAQVMGEARGVMESRHGEFMVSKPRYYVRFLGEIPPPLDRFLFGGEWSVVEV